MIVGVSLEVLRDTALEARPNPRGYHRGEMLAGWVTQEKIGRTGARVTKFAFGDRESTQLVVLSQQRGHDTIAGTVHGVESYRPPSAIENASIRFDRGRPIEAADTLKFMSALATRF